MSISEIRTVIGAGSSEHTQRVIDNIRNIVGARIIECNPCEISHIMVDLFMQYQFKHGYRIFEYLMDRIRHSEQLFNILMRNCLRMDFDHGGADGLAMLYKYMRECHLSRFDRVEFVEDIRKYAESTSDKDFPKILPDMYRTNWDGPTTWEDFKNLFRYRPDLDVFIFNKIVDCETHGSDLIKDEIQNNINEYVHTILSNHNITDDMLVRLSHKSFYNLFRPCMEAESSYQHTLKYVCDRVGTSKVLIDRYFAAIEETCGGATDKILSQQYRIVLGVKNHGCKLDNFRQMFPPTLPPADATYPVGLDNDADSWWKIAEVSPLAVITGRPELKQTNTVDPVILDAIIQGLEARGFGRKS
jgi:hypothetical protein